MPRPLPDAPQIGSSRLQLPEFSAPAVTPMRDARGEQIERLGNAVEGVGTEAVRIADILQDKEDNAISRQLDSRLSDAYREILAGYTSKLGQDAIDGRKGVEDRLRAVATEIGAGARTAMQQQHYGRMSEDRLQRALTAVTGHQLEQTHIFEMGETKAHAGALYKDALQQWQSPKEFRKLFDSARAADREYARQAGMGPKAAEQYVQTNSSKLHGAIVNQLIDAGKPGVAIRHLEDAVRRGELDPMLGMQLDDAAQEASLDSQSQTLAEQMRKYDESFPELRDRVLQLRADGVIDIDVADKAIARLERMDHQDEAARTRASNKAIADAEVWAKSTRGNIDWASPEGRRQKRALEKTGNWKRFEIFLDAGGQWVTTEVGETMLMRYRESPALLKGYGDLEKLLSENRLHMDNDALRLLASMWGDVHKQAKPKALPGDWVTDRIDRKLVEAGIYSLDEPVTPEQKFRADRIRAAVKEKARNAEYEIVDPAKLDAALEEVFSIKMQFTSTIGDTKGQTLYQPKVTLVRDELGSAKYLVEGHDQPIPREQVEHPDTQRRILSEIDRRTEDRDAENALRKEKGQPLLEPLVVDEKLQAQVLAEILAEESKLKREQAQREWEQFNVERAFRLRRTVFGGSYFEAPPPETAGVRERAGEAQLVRSGAAAKPAGLVSTWQEIDAAMARDPRITQLVTEWSELKGKGTKWNVYRELREKGLWDAYGAIDGEAVKKHRVEVIQMRQARERAKEENRWKEYLEARAINSVIPHPDRKEGLGGIYSGEKKR